MNRKQIDNLINNLSWDSNPKNIEDAKQKLSKLKSDDIGMLILPGFNKNLWENAALVLKEIGYPTIRPVVFNLLDWLQDLNWPGAYTIMNLLATVEKSVLVYEIEKKLDIDVVDDVPIKEDDMWLGVFNLLIKKMNLRKEDFSNKDKFEIINSYK